jgi:hypothetical protein
MFTSSGATIAKAKIAAMVMPILLFVANSALAQVGIRSFSSTYTAASTGSRYNTSGAPGSPLSGNDYTYRYGTSSTSTDNILNFSSFSIGTSATYAYRNITDAYVKIRRKDNALVSGVRQLLWYEAMSGDVSDGVTLRMKQPYQESMEIMFNGARGLNAGTDNIFNNSADGNGNNNNIERFDYIIPDGYSVASASQEGFIVMDRGVLNAHDPFCVAVVTALDASGNPSAYTNVVRVNSTHYGTVNPIPVMSSNVLRKDASESALKISTNTTADQGIGGVFIRFSDVGLSSGATVYGYSVFGADFPVGGSGANVVNWTNSTYFPTNTAPGNGGLDMLAVSGIFQLSNALAPIANDVSAAGICNATGTGKKVVPALSANDLNSGGSIVSYKIITVPSASQGVLFYNNGSGDVPVTAGLVLTIAQSSTLKFDPADGYAGDAVFQYTATNAFGLVSNVAYGTISVFQMPTTSAGSNIAICAGGSATITPTGATDYVWSPSTGLNCNTCDIVIASPSVTSTYTISGTHPAVGCSRTATLTISVNPLPSISAGSSVAICRGTSTTLTASGGTTYSWVPSTGLSCTNCANPVASPTTTTTYTVTGTTNGCSRTATVTVTVNSLPTVSAGFNVTRCEGVATTLTGSGASTYVWSPATGLSCISCTSPSATPSVTTTYTVTGTGSNGCQNTSSVTVTITPAPNVVITGGGAMCVGGSLPLNASGATSYSWSPSTGLSCSTCASPVTTSTVTRVYVVTGTTAGCSGVASTTVTVNAAPVVSAGTNVAICSGNSTTLNATGATSYTWSPSIGLSCSTCASPIATPTSTTTYTLTGTNPLPGCSSSATVRVTVNPTPALPSGVTELCVGRMGTMSCVTASGTWSSSNTSVATVISSNGTVTGVAAGTANISYNLASGCFSFRTISVNPAVSATASSTNASCNGSNNGSVVLTVSGGTPAFGYAWSNGATTKDISGLVPGTYSVTITDSKGCTSTASRTITQPSVLSASSSGTNVLCNGGTTGAVSLTVSGGTTPYSYSWSNGSTNQNLTGLAAGTYSVLVTDANGCTTTTTRTLTQPSAIAATAVSTDISCFGLSNGSIDVSVSGGVGSYTYAWSNGATTQDVTGLGVGSYNVTIRDANNCTATLARSITQPAAALTASITATNVSCNSGANGAIDVTTGGGTSPYTYSWNGGATTEDRSGLTAGTYTVTITDAKGCTFTGTRAVSQPMALSATGTHTNVACFGGGTGAINLTVTGGTTPYSYLWNGGATTEDMTGLAAGTHSVTITDANGCTALFTTNLTQPAALNPSANITSVSCNGGSNGVIDVSVTGGTSPYFYHWENALTSQDRMGLAAGSYSLTVTDAKSCTATLVSTVTQPAVLAATSVVTNIPCNGGGTGAINVTVTGGTTPYSYFWVGGATTEDRTALNAGTYTLTVTDAKNCQTTVVSTVGQPNALTATTASTNALCFGCANGTASVSPAGGTPAYTYLWSNGATTASVS